MGNDFRFFLSPNHIQKEILCYIDGMGIEENSDLGAAEIKSKNCLLLHTISGKLWCCLDKQEFAVYPGESVLLNMHDSYRYHMEGSTTKIAWMHINGFPAMQLLKYLEQCNLRFWPVKLYDAKIYPQMLAIFEMANHLKQDIYTQSAMCYSLLLKFLEGKNQQQNFTEDVRQAEFKQRIGNAILSNLSSGATVEEFARSVFLSKYHFIRKFHGAFGMSPKQFIIHEKIRQAEYRLIYTKETVSQISEALGFATPSYFSKVFKQVSGFSPSDFRKHGIQSGVQ